MSTGAHALVLGALFALSLVVVGVVEPPRVVSEIVFTAQPARPPTPAPAPPLGSTAPGDASFDKAPAAVPEPILEPVEVRETLAVSGDDPRESLWSVDLLDGALLGTGAGGDGPAGSEDGIPNGVPGGTGSELLTPGVAGVTLPELILSTKVRPVFPEMARMARREGRVILRAVVLSNGLVSEVEVLSCKPERLGFAEAAMEAVRQWRYKPALQGGVPVDVHFSVMVDFTLE